MKKEKAKHESPYKGIFRFASEKKQQLTFSVILSVLSTRLTDVSINLYQS